MSSKRLVWTKRIEAWRASGESAAGFCRARGLNRPQFVYWQRVLHTARPTSAALVPVVVTEPAVSPFPIELILPNGVQVRCSHVSDALALARGWSC
jgi:maltodextrin utilization protein YvdJ